LAAQLDEAETPGGSLSEALGYSTRRFFESVANRFADDQH
jgi:hypothetical protein